MTKDTIEKLVLAGVVILVAFFNLNLVFENKSLSLYLTSTILVVILTVATLKLTDSVLYFLTFTIPISININFGQSSGVSGPSELLCAFLTLYFVLRFLGTQNFNLKLLKHPVTILLLIDLVWLFITALLSEMPGVSFKRWIIRAVYVVVYYFMMAELFQSDRKKMLKVFLFYCLGLSVPILYYLYQHQQIGFAIQGSTLFSRPFYNDHTLFGAALVYFVPFLVYFIFYQQRPLFLKTFYVLFFLLFMIAVFFSYSRAAWLSLLCAIGVFLIFRWKIRTKTILAVLIGGGIVLFFLSGNIKEYFERNNDLSHGKGVGKHFKSVTNINTDASNVERINRWKCAYRMFLDKPIAGFGPGTYQFYYGNYQIRTDFNYNSTYSGDKGHAHSEYLNYLSETGIIGLLIFVMGIFVVSLTAIRILRRDSDPMRKSMTLSLFMGLITFYIHSFFNGFIESDKMAMPVFSSMAAIAIMDILFRKERGTKAVHQV